MRKHLLMLGALLSFIPAKAVANEGAINRLVQTQEASKMENFVQMSMADRKSVACMALAIYHESKSESIEGQRAVGHVVKNRMASPKYPSTACGVVFQTYRGRPQFVFVNKNGLIPSNSRQWGTALKLAYEVHKGVSRDPTAGAFSFHNPRLSGLKRSGVRIGNHVFHKG